MMVAVDPLRREELESVGYTVFPQVGACSAASVGILHMWLLLLRCGLLMWPVVGRSCRSTRRIL